MNGIKAADEHRAKLSGIIQQRFIQLNQIHSAKQLSGPGNGFGAMAADSVQPCARVLAKLMNTDTLHVLHT